MSKQLGLASLLAASGLLIGVPAAQAAEWRVGTDGLTTIGEAVRRAQPGDVVAVGPGTYREHVVLDRAVSLVGTGLPVIDGGGTGDVVTVKAPGCRIAGLRITASGHETLDDTAGIKVLAHRTTIEDCTIDTSLFGLYVAFADHNRFRANRITGLKTKSREDRGDAIRLHASNDNHITDHVITEARDGIYFNGSSRNRVTDNTLTDLRYGLHYMSSDDNHFENNRFMRTDAGAALMFSRRLTLRHNLFTGNRGFRAYGLLVKDVEDSTITENVLSDNRTGLFLDGAIGCRITHNRIAGNDLGVEVRANSENNMLEGNVITGNTAEVALPTGRAFDTWTGNHWGAYQGYDMDGDGVGDVPHRAGDLFSYVSEYLPPARLFLLGPAVQALAFAERTFPVIDAPQVTDERPILRADALPKVPPPPRAAPPAAALPLTSALMLGLALVPIWLARRTYR